MIEIKDGVLYMDDYYIAIDYMTIFKKPEEGGLYLKDIVSGECIYFDEKLEDLYSELQKAGYDNFYLQNDTIINLENVLSICETNRFNTTEELHYVTYLFDGREEDVEAPTREDVDRIYLEVRDKIYELKERRNGANCD